MDKNKKDKKTELIFVGRIDSITVAIGYRDKKPISINDGNVTEEKENSVFSIDFSENNKYAVKKGKWHEIDIISISGSLNFLGYLDKKLVVVQNGRLTYPPPGKIFGNNETKFLAKTRIWKKIEVVSIDENEDFCGYLDNKPIVVTKNQIEKAKAYQNFDGCVLTRGEWYYGGERC